MSQVCTSEAVPYRSDARWARTCSDLKGSLRERKQRECRLRQQLDVANEKLRQLQRCNHSLARKADDAQRELEFHRVQAAAQANAAACPNERPLPGHQFSTRMIALAIELAKRVGFRAAEFALKKVFDAWGIDRKVPSHDAIEQWTLRVGVAELADTFTKDQRVLWMADHSNQIGQEKVLLIVGILIDDLPQPGDTLNMDKLKVLAIVPGKSWTKEDVESEYKKLAGKTGPPVYLLCDGAVELREPAEKLEKDGRKTIALGDLKHHAANLLEKQIGRDERFKAFMSEVGLARSRVQQTELGHFTPLSPRPKSRFMNLAALLRWSQMVLHHLAHPESASRRDITVERMEEKFGWMRGFTAELSVWSDCQAVIGQTLAWINRQGLTASSSAELRQQLAVWFEASKTPSAAREIAEGLLKFIREHEQRLPSGGRAWLSTEIIESLFGRFKRLERQHSKGGFTRLIAALPTLCRNVTQEMIRHRFTSTKSRDVLNWLRQTLPNTLTARRNAAYREFQPARKTTAAKQP